MEQLIFFLVLLALGYIFGRRAEARHYRSIHEREELLRQLVVLPNRVPPTEFRHHDSQLVSGSVVISVDYFKTVVAGLRNLVGGRIGAYESLLDRGRREAILRMQEEAQVLGATAIMNLRVETSRIGQNARQGLGSVEMLAYGTAMIPPADPRS
ncbi:YbjQ family protein [Oceanobacter mangrovi]|uniref:YbjQ family protein n=1 Tax=Oceanobacter mangrovi TaxID=2862510 RepID=UPI001C8E4276|nr:YbjQ family protein [Oceanobacter mangrovi]